MQCDTDKAIFVVFYDQLELEHKKCFYVTKLLCHKFCQTAQ